MVVHHPDAGPGETGHPLFIHPGQRGGRIDNPGRYRVLYVADDPECAVAEAFAQFGTWSDAMFEGPPVLVGSRRRLAAYEVDIAACVDLDDAATLQRWSIRPSEVVTRQRRVSQAWALRIFEAGEAIGVGWWSFHNPDWPVRGLWDQRGITVVAVDDLVRSHPAVTAARQYLHRAWRTRGRPAPPRRPRR